MPTEYQTLRTAFCLSICSILACSLDEIPGNPFVELNPNEVEVNVFNFSDIAVNILGPGEVAQPSNFLQPGTSRVAIVQFTPNGDVSFRATNDQGFFSIATWKFAGQFSRDGDITFTAEKSLTCTKPLFAENFANPGSG
jgi:hypothetical protein